MTDGSSGGRITTAPVPGQRGQPAAAGRPGSGCSGASAVSAVSAVNETKRASRRLRDRPGREHDHADGPCRQPDGGRNPRSLCRTAWTGRFWRGSRNLAVVWRTGVGEACRPCPPHGAQGLGPPDCNCARSSSLSTISTACPAVSSTTPPSPASVPRCTPGAAARSSDRGIDDAGEYRYCRDQRRLDHGARAHGSAERG